jgi:hypothetical protein
MGNKVFGNAAANSSPTADNQNSVCHRSKKGNAIFQSLNFGQAFSSA